MSLIQTSRMKLLITHVHLVTINKSMTLHWFMIYLHISLKRKSALKLHCYIFILDSFFWCTFKTSHQ